METEKPIEKINDTKSWFFQKIKIMTNFKLDSPRKWERGFINKIRNGKGEVTTDTKKYKGS